MKLYRIVAETFEAKPYPIVVHTFIGETMKEADGYFKAHLESDRFFYDCTKLGSFRGKFRCRTVVRDRGWVETG